MHNSEDKFIKRLKQIPLSILIVVSLISIYGFIILYSAAGGNIEPWANKQIMVFLIFLPISILVAIVDLKIIYHFSYLFYFLTLILLVTVEFSGKSAMGATRWLNLGLITIQPSELTKISIILALARYFHDNHNKLKQNTILIIPLFIAIIPIAIVIKQPDLGTGIITLMVAAIMFFLAGVRFLYFIICLIGGLIATPVIWILLHDYQKNRIVTFMHPEQDALGTGYNIIQSKIAIGSGGFFGKGLLNGTQGQLSFLPEYQTDFIFSFLMEELGFIGGIVLLALYAIIIMVSLLISINCQSIFAKLMSSGIAAVFFCHVFINIAMVMGLVPVVGVPLPLISYGRTMMVSMILGLGLVMNAAVNRLNKIIIG